MHGLFKPGEIIEIAQGPFKGFIGFSLESAQFRVLRLLESNPHLIQRELLRSLRVNLGGINYSLNALVAKGSVKIQNF